MSDGRVGVSKGTASEHPPPGLRHIRIVDGLARPKIWSGGVYMCRVCHSVYLMPPCGKPRAL